MYEVTIVFGYSPFDGNAPWTGMASNGFEISRNINIRWAFSPETYSKFLCVYMRCLLQSTVESHWSPVLHTTFGNSSVPHGSL